MKAFLGESIAEFSSNPYDSSCECFRNMFSMFCKVKVHFQPPANGINLQVKANLEQADFHVYENCTEWVSYYVSQELCDNMIGQ